MILGFHERITFGCLIIILFFSSCEENPIELKNCDNISDHWIINTHTISLDLRQNDFYFTTLETGISVGQAGSIKNTTDGGVNWEVFNDFTFKNKITQLNLNQVFFIDPENGYITGERMNSGNGEELGKGAALFRTRDGGKSWDKKYFTHYQRFDDILFSDTLNGLAIIYYNPDSTYYQRGIFQTNDGGINWNLVPDNQINGGSLKFETYKSNIYYLGKDANQLNILAITTDGGKNWVVKNLPQIDCERIFIKNDCIYYTICGSPFFEMSVYQSSNCGDSWQILDNSPLKSNSIIHFSDYSPQLVINTIFKDLTIGGETYQVVDKYEFWEQGSNGKWVVNEIPEDCNFNGVVFNFNFSNFFILGDKFISFKLR